MEYEINVRTNTVQTVPNCLDLFGTVQYRTVLGCAQCGSKMHNMIRYKNIYIFSTNNNDQISYNATVFRILLKIIIMPTMNNMF